jgi:anti-sigma B factor antagonist
MRSLAMIKREPVRACHHVSLDHLGETTVVRLDPQCRDAAILGEALEELGHVAEQVTSRRVVVNLSAVIRFPSALLGRLLTLHRKLSEGHVKLVLCGVGPDVRAIFRVTQLDRIFQICDSEASAV